MANFDVKCPDQPSMPCNLPPTEKESLDSTEKYKAFFILQYNDNDEYLEPVLEKYLKKKIGDYLSLVMKQAKEQNSVKYVDLPWPQTSE